MVRKYEASAATRARKLTNRKHYAKQGLAALEGKRRELQRKIDECDAALADLRAEFPEWDGKIQVDGKWIDAG
jgi:chromosome segregation ATPase